jgi:hypothetical protein
MLPLRFQSFIPVLSDADEQSLSSNVGFPISLLGFISITACNDVLANPGTANR